MRSTRRIRRRVRAARGAAMLVPGVVAAIAVIVVRLHTSRERRIYSIWPDEPAQLAIARFIGTGVRWNMHNHSTWRPLYGTLLGSAYWFTSDPSGVFRTGLVYNAVLGGVSCALLYLVARRLTGLGPLLCAAIALLAALAPAIVFTTNYVWSEALVQPLSLGTLLLLLRFHDLPTLTGGLAVGTLAIAAFGAHSRMLPLAVLVVAVVAAAAAKRRLAMWRAALIAAWTAAAFAAVSRDSDWIVEQLWNEPFERNSYGGVLDQLTEVDDMFVALVGQAWYQLVATAGIVGIGAVTLVRAVRTGRRRGRGRLLGVHPSRADAVIVGAAVASLVGLSVVFMADRWRADQIVYGRYNDAAVAPLLVLGLATVAKARRLTAVIRAVAAVAATTAVLGAILWLLRRNDLRASVGVRAMVLGLQPFLGSRGGIDVAPITATAVVVAVALAGWIAISRLGAMRPAALLGVAALALIGYLRTEDIVNRNRNGWAIGRGVAELQGTVVPAGAPIDYVLRDGSNDTGRMMVYQFYLPTNPFEVVPAVDLAAPATPFVFARSDNSDLLSGGALIAWTDPGTPLSLWVLAGDHQAQLVAQGLLPAPAGTR